MDRLGRIRKISTGYQCGQGTSCLHGTNGQRQTGGHPSTNSRALKKTPAQQSTRYGGFEPTPFRKGVSEFPVGMASTLPPAFLGSLRSIDSTVLVFEGWDAAGKGSAIKRVTGAIDARLYRIVCVGAPTDEENQFHYLWRFWKPLPAAGRVTIFDRSWYGRVLVERVEKFAKPEEWKRAYEEINAFEKQLLSQGTVLCKFWIHISPEKQMERFQKRLEFTL